MLDSRRPRSVNQRFQAQHARHLLRASVAAVVLTVLFAALTPPYIPAPYQLQAQELPLRFVPDDPYIPPEVPDLAQTPPYGEITPDPDAPDGPPPDTGFNPFEVPPLPPPPQPDYVCLPEIPPRVIHAEPAVYPEIALSGNATGWVKVCVTVSEDGRVIRAAIYESSATQALEDAALAAAGQYLFTPAMQRDRPVRCQVVIQFNFGLE
jgi:TonB family protein